jgi:hypothetical protein
MNETASGALRESDAIGHQGGGQNIPEDFAVLYDEHSCFHLSYQWFDAEPN